MIAREASLLIAHMVAFTRLYDRFMRLEPTKDQIASFRECTDSLHELLRVAALESDPIGRRLLGDALGSLQTWVQAHDQHGAGPHPRK